MMAAQKKHDRKLGLCAASLTEARLNRHTIGALKEVQDFVESMLIKSDYLKTAPFEWVTISLRFGLVNDNEPHYDRINEIHGDLPLAIEIDTHLLVSATHRELQRLFTIAVLKALIHAGKKYDLPVHELTKRLDEISCDGTHGEEN